MRILLTGGRAPVALELARLFARHGQLVFMAESLRLHLSAPSRSLTRNFLVPSPNSNPGPYIQALIHIIQTEHIDLLIPTCEEIFWIAQYHAQLSQYCHIFCEPLDKLRPLHNKWDFAQRALSYDLCVPTTNLITNPSQLTALQPSLVLKPVYSRFAAKTRVWLDGTVPAIQPSPQHPWVAQEFIAGQQFCSYSIAHQGRLLAHTCYPTLFTAGQGATIHFQHCNHPAVLQWVSTFVQHESFTGQIAFDFIQTPSGDLYAIECNPRATSGIHLLTSNSHFAQTFLCPEQTNPITPDPSATAMLAAPMLLYGLPPALASHTFSRWVTAFASTRDVLFTWNDPLPTLWQFFSLVSFIAKGFKHHVSPLEASTLDMEWNGD